MKKRVIWQARTSIFLYLYQYLFLIALTILLYKVQGIAAIFPVSIAIGYMVNAKSMKYELTEDSVFLSPSLLERESTTVNLKDIVGFHVVDAPPWSYISLGTVLLITDFDNEMHSCIISIRNPHQLAAIIEKYAVKQGATIQDQFD